MSLKPAINDSFDTVTAVIPNMVAAFARLKNSIDIDVSGISQSIKSGFDLLNTALGEFAQNGELTQATIDKIKTKIAEIGPAAVAAWAMMNPKSAIATLMPLLSGLGKIGVALGKVAVEAQTSGSVMGNVFETISAGLLKLDDDGNATAEGFRKAAGEGVSAMATMANGITSVASMALAAIGPAAILGLVVAGVGLINSQFVAQID